MLWIGHGIYTSFGSGLVPRLSMKNGCDLGTHNNGFDVEQTDVNYFRFVSGASVVTGIIITADLTPRPS